MKCLPTEPTIAVGILRARSLTIDFIDGFSVIGVRTFTAEDPEFACGSIRFDGSKIAAGEECSVFEVRDVVIGIGFHWERRENQRFTGSVEIIPDGDELVLVNHVGVESYLCSVISSEMSASASEALLCAHAVISRSWVLRQCRRFNPKKNSLQAPDEHKCDGQEIVRWYDHDDHTLFDVCADDHCQRYQGITRMTSPTVRRAVNLTRGVVLSFGDEICDARFSKCCGGAMETFGNCWEGIDHPYLQARADSPTPLDLPALNVEANARKWIHSRHDSFCNCTDSTILSQVLNNYDRETPDFYRWHVDTDGRRLGELIRKKAGINLGNITDLEPLTRGDSGRIVRLRIVGTHGSRIVGKELEIRRWLSPTHLLSSAFTVESHVDDDGLVHFHLDGAGWGHGVGLCQIGAAVMGARGYDYTDILAHYYPSSNLTRLYQ